MVKDFNYRSFYIRKSFITNSTDSRHHFSHGIKSKLIHFRILLFYMFCIISRLLSEHNQSCLRRITKCIPQWMFCIRWINFSMGIEKTSKKKMIPKLNKIITFHSLIPHTRSRSFISRSRNFINFSSKKNLSDRHLIFGQCSCLISTDNIYTSECFHGS